METTFRIRRFNPEVPGKNKPYWQEFVLKDVDPTDRVLELLHRIKWEQDGTLTLRRQQWTLPESVAFGDARLKPLLGGETLNWKMQ